MHLLGEKLVRFEEDEKSEYLRLTKEAICLAFYTFVVERFRVLFS